MELDGCQAYAVVVNLDEGEIARDSDANSRRVGVVGVRDEFFESLHEGFVDPREFPDDRRIDTREPHRLSRECHAPRGEEPPHELLVNFTSTASPAETAE